MTGSVTKKTNYLINNDIQSSSSKNKKARELGIPILSEEDFLNLVGNAVVMIKTAESGLKISTLR